MRYDIPVFFQSIKAGAYNPETGNYGPDEVVEDKKYANVTDAGVETLKIVYGEIRQGVLAIQLQNHYEKPFDRVRIGRKMYHVDYSRRFRTKGVYVVSEVQ
ncbi:hypothetical protein [Hespellia stercorisuis]|uniref:Uncharacterized protein n=1 Tax=Hespellia stercorisuis DSM 15480 TaxID=1121950 RepID=A0A1M6RG71_9FIRM|nr:hypothetical protein [Hespellia stercorisuis]SHK31464.1 hypothetical protein SAMN02745243_02689 [Hespellia stercorisuis DSM 15480]